MLYYYKQIFSIGGGGGGGGGEEGFSFFKDGGSFAINLDRDGR